VILVGEETSSLVVTHDEILKEKVEMKSRKLEKLL